MADSLPSDIIPDDILTQQYTVSPGDLLEIDVFEVEELTRTIRVRSNGYIALPLIGSVKVQGLTERELEIALEVLLKEKYLHDPHVSVFVRESGFFYVLGRVENKEGIFPYRPGITLQQAIAMGGAFPGEESGIKEVQITRTLLSGEKETYTFDYDGITRGKLGSIPIMRDDVVFVKGLGKLYVTGEVTRPGSLDVRPEMSVQQAIAFAGGLSSVSKSSRVKIKRTDEAGNVTIMTVNYNRVNSGKADDIGVMEGDIIYVPKSYLRSIARAFFFTIGVGDGTVGVRSDRAIY
ncbi:MAG: polysaccharide biosynthesis/export family protein [Proteobacteria bacterium]|nr:polysaccharide biosynthesis/export family protein [Pseudomonadota bacterium]